MCDYSLHNVKSRPAKVGDKLTTRHFNTGTRGFAAPEDPSTAVCVLPGTELAFVRAVSCQPRGSFGWKAGTLHHTTAIFRQVNKDNPRTHHDALEFPDGQIVLLTDLFEVSGSNSAPASGATCYCGGSGGPGTGRVGRLISSLARASRPPSIGRPNLVTSGPSSRLPQCSALAASGRKPIRNGARDLLITAGKA